MLVNLFVAGLNFSFVSLGGIKRSRRRKVGGVG